MTHLAIIEDMPTEAGIIMLVAFLGYTAIIPLLIGLAFRRTRRIAFWLLAIDVAGLSLMHLLGSIIMPVKTKHPMMACQANLRQISMACKMYEMDHTNALPRTFSDLREYIDNPRCFICPRTQDPREMSNVSKWTPYVIRAGETNGSSILLYCSRTNHSGSDGTWVISVDGESRWCSPEELKRELEQTGNAQQQN